MNSFQDESFTTPIRFTDGRLFLLDQRQLPMQESWLEIADTDAAIDAIRGLVVRGAPAIGICAAYAAALAARSCQGRMGDWLTDLERLEVARPTAVNLSWALNRMRRRATQAGQVDPDQLAAEALCIHREDVEANRAMARAGAALIEPGSGVLTHCNTGALATGGIGTALGVISEAWQQGRIDRVFADETRPWLQGSRLTAWELARQGIEFRIIVEGAAAALMASGQLAWVITGADRVAANGDVANKVGTCMLAVLARHYGVKMMVVAPGSTVDTELASGQGIKIEQRDESEIWSAAGIGRADLPVGFRAWNPVFDITPGELIDCIVTDQGVHRPPYGFTPSPNPESP